MKAETTVAIDNIEFTTRTNGDKLRITKMHFDPENAANLATLINSGVELKLIIKDTKD